MEAADADLIVFVGPGSFPTDLLEEWLRCWVSLFEDAALAVIQEVSAGRSLVAPAVPTFASVCLIPRLEFLS